MKKSLFLILFCSNFFTLSYVKKTTWIEAQKSGKLPVDVQKQLDEFFADKSDFKQLLRSKKPVYPSKYRVSPNNYYRKTFDPKIHLWQPRPPAGLCTCLSTDSHEKKPAVDIGDAAKQKFDKEAVVIMQKYGLYSWSSRNFIIPVDHKGIPYVLQALGTDEQVYPLQVSRFLVAQALEKHLVKKGFTHIKVPKTYLYYLGDKPNKLPLEDLKEEDWLIVQEHIESVVPVNLIKKRFVFMDTVYELERGLLADVEKRAALKQADRFKKSSFNNLSPADVRKKTIYEWHAGLLSKKRITNAVELIEQIDQFLGSNGEAVFWDSLIHKVDKNSDDLRGANFILQQDPEGLFTLCMIDCEMGFRRGEVEDEQVCVNFTGDDSLQMYKNDTINYSFLRTPYLKDMREAFFNDLPELIHDFAVEELSKIKSLLKEDKDTVAKTLKERITSELVPCYQKRLIESERVTSK